MSVPRSLLTSPAPPPSSVSVIEARAAILYVYICIIRISDILFQIFFFSLINAVNYTALVYTKFQSKQVNVSKFLLQ